MDEQLIIEIWETFKDYIPEKSRGAVAEQFIDFVLGKEVDPSDLEGMLGYDPHLDQVIESVLKENQEDDLDDEEQDTDGWDYDEEED